MGSGIAYNEIGVHVCKQPRKGPRQLPARLPLFPTPAGPFESQLSTELYSPWGVASSFWHFSTFDSDDFGATPIHA